MVLSAVTENRSFYLFLIPAVLGMVAAYWNAINRGYNFTAAISPDGIRLRYGLLDTQAQTLPPGRIQALRVSQPPLWRIFGWYRIQVNVAGYGAAGNNGEGSSRTTLLPVGTFPDVLTMLSLVLPDPGTPDPVRVFTAGVNGLAAGRRPEVRRGAPADPGTDDGGFVTTPRRARLLAPLGWRRNGFTATDTALLIRSGRWWRHLVVVPHQRTQSMALEQGPLARRFRRGGPGPAHHGRAGVPAADPGRPGRGPGPAGRAGGPGPGRAQTADQRALAGPGPGARADPTAPQHPPDTEEPNRQDDRQHG